MTDAIKEAMKIGDNAGKWAEAFARTFPDCNIDEDTMMGWFANAIETACDRRHEALVAENRVLTNLILSAEDALRNALAALSSDKV